MARKIFSLFLFLFLVFGLDRLIIHFLPKGPADSESLVWSSPVDTAAHTTPMFVDTFTSQLTLNESNAMKNSSSPNWWLNSGGQFIAGGGVARTLTGDLSTLSPWYLAYSVSNPRDTDGGLHPQNIFRLVNRHKWTNFEQSVYFKIKKDNLSSSPNRNESNGLFLFNRYQDGKNIYYTGLRVDGGVVVKKKLNGTYYTLGFKKLFPGVYNRDTSPDLLPKDVWVGLKSRVATLPGDKVNIKLLVDKSGTGQWDQVLDVTDSSKYGPALLSPGFSGLRTDFMDVEFRDYQIQELSAP